MYEIENAVLFGFLPGDERRPGNWTLRRGSGSEAAEAAAVTKTSEVRESIPVPLDKAGIHAIDSDHNHFRR